jgi:hypothetical protein
MQWGNVNASTIKAPRYQLEQQRVTLRDLDQAIHASHSSPLCPCIDNVMLVEPFNDVALRGEYVTQAIECSAHCQAETYCVVPTAKPFIVRRWRTKMLAHFIVNYL